MTFLELLNTMREVENTIKKEKSVLNVGETKKKRNTKKSLKKAKAKASWERQRSPKGI